MGVGVALYKIKVMPETPSTDLNSLKEKITKNISDVNGQVTGFEEQPVAFGLKALIVAVRISEDIDSSKVENAFEGIEGISSRDVIDYRRAIE